MSGIYGSSRLSGWLRDARDGIDSVDFLLFGDENVSTNGGWTQGFVAGPALNGISMYASPFFQTATNFLPVYAATPQTAPTSTMSDLATVGVTAINTLAVSGGTAPSSGVLSAPAAVKAHWNSNPLLSGNGVGLNYGGTLGDGLKFMDFIWQPSGTFWTNFINGIQMSDGSIPNCFTRSTVCTFRMLYATSGSGASVNVIARAEAPESLFFGETTYSLADTSGATAILEHTRTAGTPTTANKTIFSFTDYNGSGGTDRLTGPIGIYGYSVYKQATKGVAATIGHQWALTGLANIASGLSRDSALIKTLLKELRARQISAGGTGRVCILLQGGQYVDTPLTVVNDIPNSITDIRNDWTSLGYSEDDITFVVMVNHAATAGIDPLLSTRAAAKSTTIAVDNATFIDLNEIAPNSTLSANGWLNLNPLQLTSTGYTQVGLSIFSNLVEYKDPTPYKRLALSRFGQPVHRWDVVVDSSGFATLTINRTVLVGRYPTEDCAKAVVIGLVGRFGSVVDAANRVNNIPHGVRYL